MQDDQPYCWNAHANATMLDIAITRVGDENGCNQGAEHRLVIFV
jgi:hypothetical protein